MSLRATAAIDQDIARASLLLADLQVERAAARQDEIDRIVRMFDGGLNPGEISRQVRLTKSCICGILHREGRSQKARENIRQRARSAVEQRASA